MGSNDKDIDLFYIEDNEDFLDFVGLAVKRLDTNLKYSYVTDGQQAKELLDNSDKNASIKKAKLILLDYNLPGMSGIQLLKHIRTYSNMKHVPVVIFSSSDNPNDIRDAYSNGANAYLVKPMGMSNLKDTLQTVCDFWIKRNQYCN